MPLPRPMLLVMLACSPHMSTSLPLLVSLSFSVLVALSLCPDDDARLALPNGSRALCLFDLLFLTALALSVCSGR